MTTTRDATGTPRSEFMDRFPDYGVLLLDADGTMRKTPHIVTIA
jgi:hypothetical protein